MKLARGLGIIMGVVMKTEGLGGGITFKGLLVFLIQHPLGFVGYPTTKKQYIVASQSRL